MNNPYNQGTENSHSQTDPKDQRTIANHPVAETANRSSHEQVSSDPRDAISHGNEPSRGAEIDTELQADNEAMLAGKEGRTDSLPGKK